MHVAADPRPSSDLSDSEIVAYLFRAIRAQDLRTGAQVLEACAQMFPDLPGDRRQACFGQLAVALEG